MRESAAFGRPAVGTTSSLRGSSGMLIGYGASQLVNFLVQIAIVRQLSKADYGAFAWALAVVTLLEAVVPLGLDRASPRFLALYDERKDFNRLFGLIVLEVVVVVGMGLVVVGGAWALSPFGLYLAPSRLAVDLLVVLMVLAPLHALDALVIDMFAVFASPWSVFLRRYVLEPMLRLAVVGALVLFHEDAQFLVVGLVLAGAFGLVLFMYLLTRLFQRLGLSENFSWRSVDLPWKEVASFCGPMLLGSFVATATMEFTAVALGQKHGGADVANLRAVMPFAVLNLGVFFTFSTLFAPSAARLMARDERADVRDLYWQSAIWVSVLTFPVLGVTTAFAAPFTTFTLGERYQQSAGVLVILSVGFYVNAAFGFNGMLIQLIGRTRWIVVANLTTLAFLVAVTYPLVTGLRAIGAAIALLVTLVVHNLLKQLGLGFGAGIGVLHFRHLVVLALVCGLVGLLFAVEAALQPSLGISLGIVFSAWLGLLRLTRHDMRLHEVFPEVGRYAALRWLLGGAEQRKDSGD